MPTRQRFWPAGPFGPTRRSGARTGTRAEENQRRPSGDRGTVARPEGSSSTAFTGAKVEGRTMLFWSRLGARRRSLDAGAFVVLAMLVSTCGGSGNSAPGDGGTG